MKNLHITLTFALILLMGNLFNKTFAQDYSLDLDNIVVTASRLEQAYKNSTQNISIISRADMESCAVDEITELLDLLPSVDILEYGSIGSTRSVHTRGASSTQVLTLIDGRPVNTPRDGLTDFNQIPFSNIERVEVLRGPASNIYGANAVGGVINIITKSGKDKMQTELQTKTGSFSTNQVYFTNGKKIGDFDYFVSYDYTSSHGHRDNADYLSNNVNAKIGYELADDNRLTLTSGYFNSEAGSPGLVTNQDLDDRTESFKRYIDLTYDGKVMDNQSILLKLFSNLDRFEFIETFEPQDKSTHQTKVYGADAQVSQTFFDIYRTSLGGSFRENRLNSSNSGKHTYNLKAVYFESETDLFDSGAFKFGARLDDYSNFGHSISPSASCNFWLFDTIKFHALAARSFRAPTFNDLYWPREDWGIWGGVEGNENLGPEKAESFEAGFGGYFFNKFKTDVTLFKTNFEDLIEWTVDDSWWWRPENISSASIKGIEFETEFVLKKLLKTNFNYTYLETKDKATQKWLVYRPRHLYKLKFTYSPTKSLELGLNAIYKTKRYSNASNTSLLKQYAVFNLSSAYKLNGFTTILFEVKNVFDRDYMEERDYSMPGRAFYGGIKVTF